MQILSMENSWWKAGVRNVACLFDTTTHNQRTTFIFQPHNVHYCTLINILLLLLPLSEQSRFWWNRISSARRRGKILLFNCTHSCRRWRWRSVTCSRRCCRGGWGTRRKQYVPAVAPAKLGLTRVLHIRWGQWCWSRIYHIKVSTSITFCEIYSHKVFDHVIE